MIRLFKVNGKEGIWTSHTHGLLDTQLEVLHGLTSDNRLVCFLEKDGSLNLKLSTFTAIKDETRDIPGA